MGAPIGLAIANIIAEAHTPSGGGDVALMKGYSSAFYAYGVMGGVGIIAVVLFAANRDPAQFPEEGGAPIDMEETATIPATSYHMEGVSGDKEEIVEVVGQGNNSSSSTVGGAAASSSGANSVASIEKEKGKAQ